MKNRMKKALALLVALVLTLSLLPAAAFAAEDVTVTLEVNIRAVAEPEMLAELGVQSPLPGPVTVTVPAGSTVKDVLTQAQKDQGLDIVGLDKGFVTGIGWVSGVSAINETLGTAVQEGSFQYPGWSYAINGDFDAPAGIGADPVTEGDTYTFRYSLYGVWSGNAMHYYDYEFLDALDEARTALEQAKAWDTSAFSDPEKAALEQAVAEAETLIGGLDETYMGLWLEYVAEKGSALYGPGSDADKLIKAAAALAAAMQPSPANELTSLVVTDLMESYTGSIDFDPAETEYALYDFPTTLSMVKVKAARASGNAVVSIYLGEAAEPAAQVTGQQGDSWIILRDLDWSGTVNVLRMVVEPPEGTGLSAKTYTVRISRALTAAELEADRDALRLGSGDSTVEVSADLDLPETGASGLSSITWTSSAPDVISGSGVVRRGAKEQTVTLTATLSAAGLESLTKIFTVTVTPVGAREVLDNIAARYAASGVAGDGNGPWLAADLAAYAAAWPDRGHKLSADQVQACLDTFLAKADATDAPGDLAKYIIALRALGYDARKTVTADLREVDVVAKLTALVDGKAASVTNPYTLPYVILALQQGEGYATQAQMDYLIQAAVDSQDSWGNTSWGPDGATPMLLALAPYCDGNALVKEAVDGALAKVRACQGADGGMGNAASTGLAAMAFAALGIDPAEVTAGEGQPSLVDGLLTYVSDTLDGFRPTSNSFSTEQGFRGLIAALRYGETGLPFRLFDFSDRAMETAEATWAQHGPVTFAVIPDDAAVTVLREETEQTPAAPFRYDLPAGTYTYTVSKSGYVGKTGSFTVTEAQAEAHTGQKISVSLAAAPGADSGRSITVSVKVLTHDDSACGGKYTYKHNASAYQVVLADESVALRAGQSVFDALDAALTQAGVDYVESTPGYISSIGDEEEFGHGSKDSGWLYMVNGTTADIGCRDYSLTRDAKVIWFYTDNYHDEYGSESWGGSSSAGAADTSAVLEPQAVADKTGEAKAAVTEKEIRAALDAAQNGGAGCVIIRPDVSGRADQVTVELPRTAVERLAGETGVGLRIETGLAQVDLSSRALAALADAGGRTLSVSVGQGADGVRTVAVLVDGKPVEALPGGIRAAFPAAEAGLVPALVGADGAAAPLKKSLVADGTAYLLLPGSASVALIRGAETLVDVPDGYWGAEAVAFAASRGLLQGVGGDRFDPDGVLTRAMLVTVLYRLEGQPEGAEAAFSDVAVEAWYASAAAWAAEAGIANGVSGGAFAPERSITRQELAAMLYRYAGYAGLDTSARQPLTAFADGAERAGWAEEALSWALATGLLTGKDGGRLDPAGNASRAEVAAVLERLVGLMVR